MGFLLVLLLVGSGTVGALRPALGSTGDLERGGAIALGSAGRPSQPTMFHGDVNISLPSAAGPVPAGSQLSVSYRIAVPGYLASLGTIRVHFPTVVASFPTNFGATTVSLIQRNLSVNSPSATDPSLASTTVTFPSGISFNNSSTAYLTTAGIALLYSLPYATVAVSVSWIWNVYEPGAGVASSGWSSWVVDEPAEFVQVSLSGPLFVAAGTSYFVCLTGPFQSRTFSLHGENPSGVEFGRTTVPAPPTNSTPFCFGLPIPTGYPAQPILVHLWDYNNVTLLVRLLRATVVQEPIGWLDGTVQPPSTSLTLDGLPVLFGSNLTYTFPAPVGGHKLFASAAGYNPQSASISIVANRTTWYNVSLSPTSPPNELVGLLHGLESVPLWVWGLVAVAAGGGVLGIRWGRRRKPARDSVGPSQSPAPSEHR